MSSYIEEGRLGCTPLSPNCTEMTDSSIEIKASLQPSHGLHGCFCPLGGFLKLDILGSSGLYHADSPSQPLPMSVLLDQIRGILYFYGCVNSL